MIREHHTLRNSKDPRFLTNLLSTIIANPRIGSYVRKVELGLLSDAQAAYTEEELDIFTTAALNSTCLKGPSEEEVLDARCFWFDAILNGNDDILLAILLPLLPNLVVLSADARYPRFKWFDNAIKQAALSTKLIPTKLAQFRGFHFNLLEIQNFSVLPSVRTITTCGTVGMGSKHKISPDAISNVTHLKLWDAYVDPKTLDEFLAGFPKL